MKHVGNRSKSIVIVGVLALTVVVAAWQKDEKSRKQDSTTTHTSADTTVPGKRSNDQYTRGIKAIDEAMRELDLQMKQLDQQMRELDVQLSKDWERSVKELDLGKISKEIEAEMKKIDPDKISREVEAELGKASADKIKRQVTESMRQVELELKQADLQRRQSELAQMKISIDHDAIRTDVEKAMQSARVEMEKAKKELQLMKQFTDELQKDGLIDTAKPFTIEWKTGGVLYINGAEQPKAVQDKYRKYYKGGNYTIKMNGDDDFNIDLGDEGEVI